MAIPHVGSGPFGFSPCGRQAFGYSPLWEVGLRLFLLWEAGIRLSPLWEVSLQLFPLRKASIWLSPSGKWAFGFNLQRRHAFDSSPCVRQAFCYSPVAGASPPVGLSLLLTPLVHGVPGLMSPVPCQGRGHTSWPSSWPLLSAHPWPAHLSLWVGCPWVRPCLTCWPS